MPSRHESGMPIDADLLEGHVGIYEGETQEVLGRLAVNRIGIAVFPSHDLEIVAAELGYLGYIPNTYMGRSKVSGRPYNERTGDFAQGELHRHDDTSVIVHRTPTGSGKANFYWPIADAKGFDPDYTFDVSRDVVDLSALNVPLNADRIIVFPANTWHQFGTDLNNGRESQFRHYYPAVAYE